MRYLIDTSTISRLVRQPDELVGRMLDWGVDQIGLSPIVVFEVARGMSNLSDERREALARLLSLFMETVFDFEDAHAAGTIDSQLRNQGVEIGRDVLIAGQAMVRNLAVITHNPKHFEQVPGLAVIGL